LWYSLIACSKGVVRVAAGLAAAPNYTPQPRGVQSTVKTQ
jgi:hypothetical protein